MFYYFYYLCMNNTTGFIILIVVVVVVGFFVYKILKPYFIHYDNSILFCGGIGSGKSLNSVKTATTLLRKMRIKIWFKNLIIKIKNFLFKVLNKFKKNKIDYIELCTDKPHLYSNMPIFYNKCYCHVLTMDILTLKDRIEEYSVVLIDECSALVNQFNWNNDEVRFHLNEFIQFFRHYVGGYLILNAQANSEIVKQIRTKMNSYYWLFDFKKFLFFFYRVRILHAQCSEDGVSMSTEFIEDKAKKSYGILPRNLYDSRYLSRRYKVVPFKEKQIYTEYKKDNIDRFEDYNSRCDK